MTDLTLSINACHCVDDVARVTGRPFSYTCRSTVTHRALLDNVVAVRAECLGQIVSQARPGSSNQRPQSVRSGPGARMVNEVPKHMVNEFMVS